MWSSNNNNDGIGKLLQFMFDWTWTSYKVGALKKQDLP